MGGANSLTALSTAVIHESHATLSELRMCHGITTVVSLSQLSQDASLIHESHATLSELRMCHGITTGLSLSQDASLIHESHATLSELRMCHGIRTENVSRYHY